jgi:hypothetical protein
LLDVVDLLRISVPTGNDYDHIRVIRSTLETVIAMKNSWNKIIFNVLVNSDTSVKQVENVLLFAQEYKLDEVRIKPAHFLKNNSFIIPNIYSDVYLKIKETVSSFTVPIVLAKSDIVFDTYAKDYDTHNCLYGLHNIVVGADGYLYRCCETKYREPFKIGHYSTYLNGQLQDVLSKNSLINDSFCFTGCAGWFFNTTGEVAARRRV